MKRASETGNALAIIVVVILVMGVAAVGLWRWWDTTHTTTPTTNTNTGGLTTSTDNASLDSDLTTLNNSMNQEQSDASNVDAAINDQQVTVPTE